MRKYVILAAFAAALPMPAAAQPAAPVPLAAPISGIRLDVAATGEVTRVPDRVTIMAGVVTRAPQAEAALRDNAERMARVRAALTRLGIPARDIQTGTISLSQDYEATDGRTPRPTGYVANNQLSIRFSDVARAGRIIDALVAEGVNSVNGPMFDLADRESALNEARARALVVARQRAELYARALGTRVRRIVAISEEGAPGVRPMAVQFAVREQAADTNIEPGEQVVSATLNVTFELDAPAR